MTLKVSLESARESIRPVSASGNREASKNTLASVVPVKSSTGPASHDVRVAMELSGSHAMEPPLLVVAVDHAFPPYGATVDHESSPSSNCSRFGMMSLLLF